MRILLADADTNLRNGLRYFLHHLGHQIELAPNGEIALQFVNSQPLDLIICDWKLPALDGLRLVRAIRSNPDTAYLYVIMLAGHRATGQQIEAFDAGVDAYITKPCDTNELAAAVRSAERILSPLPAPDPNPDRFALKSPAKSIEPL